MLSSPVVDVAVGMSFIFALFSVLISKVNETITSFLGARHTGLEKALAAMLGRAQDGDISVQKVLNHPLVRTQTAAVANGTGLVQTGKRKSKGVSYLSARTFSAALLDLLKIVAPQGGSDADPMAKALETVKAMNSECPGHAVLVNLLEAAEGDRDRLRKGLEDWYDDTMDRVSGWYKRYVQRIVLVLSVALVLVVNLDAVNVAENLWQVPAERAAVARPRPPTTPTRRRSRSTRTSAASPRCTFRSAGTSAPRPRTTRATCRADWAGCSSCSAWR